ncbi:MAG TPA: MgtC/SapB family protein [Thermomicrobiales bacterium]|nr:MgtC/SapB family protein [Thermomicrobiales bacterium]
MTTLSDAESIGRIVLALVAGGIIGFERERSNKSAGLRTYALVCEGAALFMIASLLLGELARSSGSTQYDPSRIGSTIVQGIGFLAAGLIFVAGDKVRGLTTAAAIWVTAAIGLLIGAGFFVVALAGTIATLLILVSLRWVEDRFVTPGSRDAISEDDQPVGG